MKLREIFSWAFLIILMYAAQTSLLPYIGYNGISANLMLLLTVSTAFLNGYRHGVLMGLATGFLQDVTTGSYFGCTIFSYMLIGWLFGIFSDRVFKEQLLFPVIGAPLAAFMHCAIMAMLIYTIGYQIDLTYGIQNILRPMIFYQVAFSWIVHKIAYEFDKFLKRRD